MEACEIHRRAGGRRRYNAQRQKHAKMRRMLIWFDLMPTRGFFEHGQIARWAAEHGCSIATIYRDLRRMGIREQQQHLLVIYARLDQREAQILARWERRDRRLGIVREPIPAPAPGAAPPDRHDA